MVQGATHNNVTQNKNNDFLTRFKSDLDNINIELKKDLTSNVPLINELSNYLIQSGGKRIRPLLTVLSGRICNIDIDKTLNIAIIFEYLHSATLLHDDVVDESDARRGKKSSNIIWGNNIAVLVGDYLLGKALLNATNAQNMKIMTILANTACTMSEGELLQLQKKADIKITENDYYNMIRKKTAELIASACQTGAFMADVEKEKEEAVYNYGINIGMAFQIIDDALDYISSKDIMGKEPFKDIREKKVTLPLIQAIDKCSENEFKIIKKLFKKETLNNKDVQFITGLIHTYHCVEQTTETAEKFILNAKKCLNIFPQSHARTDMEDIADYIIDRKF